MIQERFSQQQRLLLESWMLAHASTRKSSLTRSFGSGQGASTKGATRQLTPSIWKRTRRGKAMFEGSCTAGPFRLFTRSVESPAEAAEFQEVLAAIRRRTLDAAAAGQSVEAAFKAAVADEPQRLRCPERMGLSFTAGVPARWWVGRYLWTPRYHLAELEEGLSAWKRLVQARAMVFCGHTNLRGIRKRHSLQELQATWQQLRAAYLEVWSQAGRDALKVSKMLSDYELRHSRRLLERWHQLQDSEPSEGKPEPGQDFAVLKREGQIEAILTRWSKELQKAAQRSRLPTPLRVRVTPSAAPESAPAASSPTKARTRKGSSHP